MATLPCLQPYECRARATETSILASAENIFVVLKMMDLYRVTEWTALQKMSMSHRELQGRLALLWRTVYLIEMDRVSALPI